MMLEQRYLARFVGPKGGVPVYALGCPGSDSGPAAFHSSVPRVLARFLGLKGGVPLYGYSTCEFPRIGRYLMRFVGMTADAVPVYALGCCQEGSSGSSGSSGFSGSSGGSGSSGAGSGLSGSSGLSGESSGASGSSGSLGSSGGSSGTSGTVGSNSGVSGSSGSNPGSSGLSGSGQGSSGSSGAISGPSGSVPGSGDVSGSVPGGSLSGGSTSGSDGSLSGSDGSDSGVSGSAGTGLGSGSCSCPEYPWQTEAFSGAAWTGDGWSLRISFEDSQNCGGPNATTQSGTASRRVCLCVPMRLSINMVGLVETQNPGYEQAQALVNGVPIASGGSFEEGGGCAMRAASASGSIDLVPGEHLIELTASTVDPQYHAGAYWEFNFTWELL